MPVNEILPFATDAAANVATQTDYAASVTTSKGHVQGVAPSKFFNKAWRQAAFVCAALAQFVAEQSGQDVRDDGNVTGLKNKLMQAIRAYAAAPPGAIFYFAGVTAPTGYLKANGAAVSVGLYPALAAYLYVGDADNPSADYGFKCTDPLNPAGTRATAGAYIVLPDYRNEFLRGWADGKSGNVRKIHQLESDAFASHTHDASSSSDGSHTHTGTTTANGAHQHLTSWGEAGYFGNYGGVPGAGIGSHATDFDNNEFYTNSAGGHSHSLLVDAGGVHSHVITVAAAGTTETRPRNRAALACIKY